MKCLSPSLVTKTSFGRVVVGSVSEPIYRYVPCGRCVNCLTNKARDWRTRLHFEMESPHNSVLFITLTFDEENYSLYSSNPSVAIRRFLERYRAFVGHSVRHWIITELGGKTKRLHFHGLIWDSLVSYEKLRSLWSYGYVWIGRVTPKTIPYISKYITKIDLSSGSRFVPQLFVSPGIGKSYITPSRVAYHRANPDRFYIPVGPLRYSLPRYYYLKIFSSFDRSCLRLDSLFNSPPRPYLFLGKVFSSFRDMSQRISEYYHESLRIGSSIPKSITLPSFILNSFSDVSFTQSYTSETSQFEFRPVSEVSFFRGPWCRVPCSCRGVATG